MKPRQPLKRTFWKRKPRKALPKVSAKRRKRAAEVRGIRQRWVNEAGACMACGHSSSNPNPALPIQCSKLAVHEIHNGNGRDKSLDQGYAVLVLCQGCNQGAFMSNFRWPEAKQLCLLRHHRPDLFDLKAYNKLVNERAPNRITIEEIDAFLPAMPGWTP